MSASVDDIYVCERFSTDPLRCMIPAAYLSGPSGGIVITSLAVVDWFEVGGHYRLRIDRVPTSNDATS